MNESPNKRAVIVGVFVLIGILFLVAGILTIGNLRQTFSTKLRVITLFDDANGLQKGNNIWFSGVKIGTVKHVDFFGQSSVKVVMNIDEKAQQYIRKNAKVKVSNDGLIGNKILIIYGGTAASPAVAEGDTLGVEKLFTTDDMINTLQENNENVLKITNDLKVVSKDLSEGHGSLGKLLKDEQVYNNIEAATSSLKNASDRAGQLMTSLSAFSAKLNKKGTLVNDLVTDTLIFNSIKSTIAELNQVVDTASLFVSNLNASSRDTKTPIGILVNDEQTGAHLKSTMENLDSSSKKLDKDLEALQHNFLLRKYFKKEAKKKN